MPNPTSRYRNNKQKQREKANKIKKKELDKL